MTSKSYTDLYYPYQVHEPEKTVSSPPAIMFLHGHGSRGDKSAVNENVYWDGVGWLLREYSKGNKTGTNVIAAEQYLTILPLMPLTDDDWIASHTMEVMKAVLAKYSSIDKARVHVGGYSRGGWGSWRTAFASPTTFASCIPAAGSGGFTDDQLKSLVTAKVPVWAWAGDSDTKVPKAQVESTVDQMKKISGAVVQITVIHGDHTTMSKEPWVEPQTWEWIANQNRDGSPAASSSNSSSLGNSSSTSLDDSSGSISTSGGSSSGSQTL
ncbi:alpha/beta-hydrolase [Meredithblackwellia eburnea MCA 4105]